MIVNERVVAYINSLDCGNSDICNTIEKEAIADEVPIIRKEMGNLLKVLLQLVQPERILEVGTAVGYSSILMSENMPEKCTITTIENYDKRIPVARNNFKRAGKENCYNTYRGRCAGSVERLWKVHMISSLWMLPRDSILIIFLILRESLEKADFLYRIIFCRREK